MNGDDETQLEHLTHQVGLMAGGLSKVARAIQSADVSAATATHRAALEQSVQDLRAEGAEGLERLRMTILKGLACVGVVLVVVIVAANLLT